MALQLTELGKDVIPLELVGTNAEYRTLRVPYTPAYPDGTEGIFSDAYLARLNDVYPFAEILGDSESGLAKRKGVERFVFGSPLKNIEGEKILAYMLINSAQAGIWQPMVIDVPKLTDTQITSAARYLELVNQISPSYNKGMIDGGILFGLAVAQRGELALPIAFDNKVIAVPSQSFVEYIAQQKD